MPSGRPTKLTDGLQTKLCDILAQGNTVTCASAAMGLSKATFYNWMRRGEVAAEAVEAGKQIEKAEEIYLSFLDTVKKAMIEAEQRCIITIMAASREHWQAAAWWLERRRPESYARRDNLNVSAVAYVGGLPELTPEQEERVKKQLGFFFAHGRSQDFTDPEDPDALDG